MKNVPKGILYRIKLILFSGYLFLSSFTTAAYPSSFRHDVQLCHINIDSSVKDTVKYCDVNGRYSIVVITDSIDVIIERYAGDKNQDYVNKTLPINVLHGLIDSANVILSKDSVGQWKELFKISNGVLFEALDNATFTEYRPCPIVSIADTIDPIEGFYNVNVSVDLYDKKGIVFTTPIPVEKRIVKKYKDGFELKKINKVAYTKILLTKTNDVKLYKVKIKNLDNVGFKDINCVATLEGNTLTFEYKVPYEEANKLPKNILNPGEWNILRFKCEKNY